MSTSSTPRNKITHASSTVSTQALCCGPIETSVFGVTSAAARPGARAHIGIRYGRVLIYLEDRTALDHLAGAVRQALEMADAVYGPVQDAFSDADALSRHHRHERTPARNGKRG